MNRTRVQQYQDERQHFLDLVAQRGATIKGSYLISSWKITLVCPRGSEWETTPKKVMKKNRGWCHCCHDCRHATELHPSPDKDGPTDWKQLFKDVVGGIGEGLLEFATNPEYHHNCSNTNTLILLAAASAAHHD